MPAVWHRKGSAPRREVGREQRTYRREERRENITVGLVHCIYIVPRGHIEQVMKNQMGPPKWPRARLTSYLQCAVATSVRGTKTPTVLRGHVSPKF
ncbi:hypothetical protein N9L68_04380 [bacterium]|nr:hypothetical protein [bacterium]